MNTPYTADNSKITDLFGKVYDMYGSQLYLSGDYCAKLEALNQLVESSPDIEQLTATEAESCAKTTTP